MVNHNEIHFFKKAMTETKNPWKTLKSDLVYESAWISINKHEVINPAGNPGIYSTVNFKNIAIGILPLDEDLNTWIVGQYRYPINKYSWEIPEGGGQLDIEPIESAIRELSEETGISAKKWTKIQEMHLSNSVTDELAILYIAQDLTFGEPHPEETEDLQVKKLHFNDLYDLVCSGEITDSLTVSIVLKTKLLLIEGKI
jgi:ADP-ribose pyrophosphatase